MIEYITNYKTREAVIEKLHGLNLNGKVYQVKITDKRAKRSLDQNALYWLWLSCIMDQTGHEKDELHDFFRAKYIGVETCKTFDSEYERIKSTTILDTAQFKQYLDKIQIFASSELGITLPDPKDKDFERFKEYYSKFL